jgi:hypothetical protein
MPKRKSSSSSLACQEPRLRLAKEEEEEEEDDDDVVEDAEDDVVEDDVVEDDVEEEGVEDDDVDAMLPPPDDNNLFAPGQKVLARDHDGLLYPAVVRRSLHGVHHHHKQVHVGMVSSQHEIAAQGDDNDTTNNSNNNNTPTTPTWHYFVHYLQWKVNWDRWVSEEDVLEWTVENQGLAKRILQEHKSLQQEFKTKKKSSSKQRIDGGAFLKVWKERLDPLLLSAKRSATESPSTTTSFNSNKMKKKKQKRVVVSNTNKAALEQECRLRTKQHLTQRSPHIAQQMVLSFGLKRILVEEWEILTQFDMVHQLPARITIRQALDQYLQSKGVVEVDDGEETNGRRTITTEPSECCTPAPEPAIREEKEEVPPPSKTSEGGSSTTEKDGGDEEDAVLQKRHNEWIDMANGICLLFDQALPFRLLYPCEQAQSAVLEHSPECNSINDNNNNNNKEMVVRPSEIYGCEYLLRLFCHLPSLLADFYSAGTGADTNDNHNDEKEDDDTTKPILAKLNDLARFLQKNQSTLFGQSYRKKNEVEVKQEQKVAKRLERKQQKQQQQHQLFLEQQQQQAAAVQSVS